MRGKPRRAQAVSRPTPRLPDPGLLGTRPLGSSALGAALRGARLVVALSGGADSVCLLHSVVRLRAWLGAEPPYGVVAAHFHHGIRGAEADADEAFASALCAELGVEFVSGRGDVPAEAARTGESPEMAARRLRRAFLRRAAAAAGAAAVATGHTLDDQAELFFLRLKRGSSSRGLGGMPPFSPWPGTPALAALRPLLAVRHAAILGWLRAEGLAWREDSTNAGDAADRNKIRHAVLPAVLDAFGPAFFDTLGRTMAALRDDDAALAAAAASAPDPSAPPAAPGRAAAAASAWASLAPALARRRLAAALYASGADPERVTLQALDRLHALLAGPGGGDVSLGSGVSVRVRRGSISVLRP